MPEHAEVHTTAGEGVDRVVPAAPRDLTVRDAILAAAELNSGVPQPRRAAPPAAAGEPGSGERGWHG
jgi:hypothetical protein